MPKSTQSPTKKLLFTVTPFSKFLALSFFIVLPFATFKYGMKYQNSLLEPLVSRTSSGRAGLSVNKYNEVISQNSFSDIRDDWFELSKTNTYSHMDNSGYGFLFKNSDNLELQTNNFVSGDINTEFERSKVFRLSYGTSRTSNSRDYFGGYIHVSPFKYEDVLAYMKTKSENAGKVKVDGVEGTKFVHMDGEGMTQYVTDVVVSKGAYTYIIEGISSQKNDPRFAEILESFKFAYK